MDLGKLNQQKAYEVIEQCEMLRHLRFSFADGVLSFKTIKNDAISEALMVELAENDVGGRFVGRLACNIGACIRQPACCFGPCERKTTTGIHRNSKGHEFPTLVVEIVDSHQEMEDVTKLWLSELTTVNVVLGVLTKTPTTKTFFLATRTGITIERDFRDSSHGQLDDLIKFPMALIQADSPSSGILKGDVVLNLRKIADNICRKDY